MENCEWHLDDGEANAWESSCGDVFFFENGDPSLNGFKFCPYCGKRLTQRAADADTESVEEWVDGHDDPRYGGF